MTNEDGSLILIANGEIYNYKELTKKLKTVGHVFRSQSDCETLIHLYEDRGLDFLEQVNGMFALALWDNSRRRLVMAVDRFGKKPIYYSRSGYKLAFASELKALMELPWVNRTINCQAVDRFLSLRYVPPPLTMFRGVNKMEPAQMLVWEDGRLSGRKYWKALPGELRRLTPAVEQEFEDLFADSVRIRLQSDVPLGIYLSGGVDSAAVAGMMGRRDGGRISYTVSVDYSGNEHDRAQRLADYLDFEFNPVTISPDDFRLLPRAVYHLDEPQGDLVILPAYLLARKAKEKLTVVLTGDGADEVLNGYLHQKVMMTRKRFQKALSAPGVGYGLSALLKILPASVLDRFFDYPDTFGPREKLKLAQAAASVGSFGSFYEGLTSCFNPQDKQTLYADPNLTAPDWQPLSEEMEDYFNNVKGFSTLSRLSLLDLKYWIPFSVVFRLDKLNMAHAVETRSPFLDYRLVNMALNLEDRAKLSRKANKIILRRMIARRYPKHLQEPGKQAFYMPMTELYRDRYRSWINDLLNPKAVTQRGLFRPDRIQNLFDLTQTGSMLATRQMTALAVLEEWFRVYVDGDGQRPAG